MAPDDNGLWEAGSNPIPPLAGLAGIAAQLSEQLEDAGSTPGRFLLEICRVSQLLISLNDIAATA